MTAPDRVPAPEPSQEPLDDAEPVKRYRTIVADPPWPMRRTAGWGTTLNNRPLEYPTMTVNQIQHLPAGWLAAETSHLYLWTTSRFLESAFVVAKAWGFRPVIPLVWCKPVTGRLLGGHFTPTAEFCIFCRRGSDKRALACDRSWFEWPRGPHSQKPEAFFDLVEQVSPGPYLELFARRQRLGWDTWGNEALEHVEMST